MAQNKISCNCLTDDIVDDLTDAIKDIGLVSSNIELLELALEIFDVDDKKSLNRVYLLIESFCCYARGDFSGTANLLQKLVERIELASSTEFKLVDTKKLERVS